MNGISISNNEFSSEEVEEFKTEGRELIDSAEADLLKLDRGDPFQSHYSALFRVFHSLKGGAGMLGFNELQAHVHVLETEFQSCKTHHSLTKEQISYFLKGVDHVRQILDGDHSQSFDLKFPPSSNAEAAPLAETPSVVSSSSANETADLKAESVPKIRVMMIDDETEILDILSMMLGAPDFESKTFSNPSQALEVIKEFRPDVLFTDFRMPEMDGMEVLSSAQRLDPDLPVIFLSGHISKDVLLKALAEGVFGALEKPFSAAQVIGMAKQATEKRRVVRLLKQAINLLHYQYSDLDQYLAEKGSPELRESMRSQFIALLEAKKALKLR